MDDHVLLNLATELGYRLAMSGAETFRVEESVNRVLMTYGIQSETFAITNCLTVSILTADGVPMTRMRRIGYHGNDLDSVERYNALSRRICSERPDPATAVQWLKDADQSRVEYGYLIYLLGNFLGALGFAVFFGGTWLDGFCAGFCGILVGVINHWMDKRRVNQFFRTIAASFLMAVPAYIMGIVGISHRADSIVIGTLMILVPGLIFVNAMRDIIFGDTNSGINRIVQVFLIAVAIALGTGAALNLTTTLWFAPDHAGIIEHSIPVQCLVCFIGCIGFSILFNIHGPGTLLCTLGGVLTWFVYSISITWGAGEVLGYFVATFFASLYAEIMARIRKYPAISYLVVSIFPLIPGAGIYYTMSYAVRGDMASFSSQGTHTIAIAGAMAVGVLFVSTAFRLITTYKIQHHLS